MIEMMKIGNVPCNVLVEKCGSPLMVYDESKIEKQLDEYKQYFTSNAFATDVIYASKAFTCKAMLQILKDKGCCLDVVSGGELYVAQVAQFPAENIYFHGNNKLDNEVEMALDYGVGTIIIDNMYEVDTLIEISNKIKKGCHVLVRINPKIEAHTHEFIMTATSDSKFGISIDLQEDIATMMQKVVSSQYLQFDGFHCHIGSQIFEREAFVGAIDKMVSFSKEMQEKTKIKVSIMNIGGGFGVTYTDEDSPTPTPMMCETLIQAIHDACDEHAIQFDKVCMEPGRSVVAEAGYTLYEVGFTKKTQNKEFAFINGGMSDNIRPALYDAKYACDIANKIGEAKTHTYDIAGKCCESGDIIIKGCKLPKVENKDILVVYTTGAYGYTMASNYNRLNKPAVVFVKEGKARIVLRRETYEDQMRCDEEREVSL